MAEHRDLMTEHHDLGVLGCLAAAEQHQPAEDPDHDQVEQAKGHKPRSCRNRLIRPIRRSQNLRRVLKRYRDHSERARVLVSLIERHKRSGDNASQFIMPLLAGLRELVIWLMQWHSQPESPFWEDSPANEVGAYLGREKAERGLQDKDLTAWRPPRPKRGRPRKTPAYDQDTLPL